MQLNVNSISLSFGDRDILKNISFTLSEKSRIALSGANGEGKTTLLKILVGEMEKDDGSVSKDKDATMLYVAQNGALFTHKTLKEEAFSIFEKFPKADNEKESLFAKISKGLGFSKADENKDCTLFSGGFQMRIMLLKALIAKPTFMFLDEPTNYLDIETRLWLVDYLNSLSGGYILVSHDKYFLDETVNEVYELQKGNLYKFKGNYSFYETERIKNLEMLIKKAAEQEKEIKKTEAFIERFRYKATKSKSVQSKIKALEKVEIIEVPPHLKHIHFTIPSVDFSPNDIFTVENVSKYYADKCIFKDVSFYVGKGERCAIIGRNGEGKSTLLRLLTSTESPTSGTIKMGAVPYVYFRGDDDASILKKHSECKDLTVLEYAIRFGEIDEKTAKNMLGAFMFSGDDILKKVGVLSGGEKSRLELLTLILHKTGLLILDEPTNHLDIASKDMLLEAIKAYNGTVVFVSHDVHFIENLATKIIQLENHKATVYDGGWNYFSSRMSEKGESESSFVFGKVKTDKTQKMNNLSKNEQNVDFQKEDKSALNSYEEAKRRRNEEKAKAKKLLSLEETIARLEAEIEENENALEQEAVYSSFEKSKEVLSKIEELKTLLAKAENEWLLLQEEC